MIVRCNNCVSAFAVDDEKIANKKFAFKCPKCSSENIIDNRIVDNISEKIKPQPEESFFNDDFSVDTDSSEKDKDQFSDSGADNDDLFFDDTENKKQDKNDDNFSSLEDELASEFPAEELTEKPVNKDRNINLEIEESADFPDIDDEMFSEKPAVKKEAEDDLFGEVPAFESDDEFISFHEDETVKVPADEFGIELKDDSVKSEEDDILFDDFDETPSKPVKKAPAEDETVFEFEDIETETLSEEIKSDRDTKLSSQDDIDALFADEGIVFDEKPISKQSEIEFEDEITVDLDMLDIELEETGSDTDNTDKEEKPVAIKSVKAVSADSDDITLDIDNLDIDLDESSLDSDIFAEPAKAEGQKSKPAISDDDITLDIENLDIDLDETSLDSDIFAEPVKAEVQKSKPAMSDDDITLDIDNLDIDLDESSLDSDIFNEPVKAEGQKSKPAISDDDITLDIDNLDIDLEDSSFDSDIFAEPAVKKSKLETSKEIPLDDEFNEEDIKLNLDDLDIDLDEIEQRELIFEDDIIEGAASVPVKKSKPLIEEDDEDESITIDLDTLEIEIAESSSIREELSEEDEKLTLDDAGLTFDELTSETKKSQFEEPLDEDLKLSLNDIDPDLTLDEIVRSAREDTELLSDSLDELPEIDLDEYDAIVRREDSRVTKESADQFEDEFVVFPDLETEKADSHKYDYELPEYEEMDHGKSSPERGNTFFSIDFSLKYSRLGALLRLLLLYSLSMIPHFIVMLIYTILSSIVGFINQIVILATGRCVEDFALVIENTMRYFFYIVTNITGIVEDRPVYAGRESIDHPLQVNITYPLKYSKNLAILRLSIVGIMLITLPHLIIMSLISITVPVVYLAGIIMVIITRRWPNLLFSYLTMYFRYMAKISSFMTGLTDEYPPFKFD